LDTGGLVKIQIQNAEVEHIAAHAMADLFAFADDAYQHAEVTGDGEWKTPKTNKKWKKPKNLCDQLSPYNVFRKVIDQVNGVPAASSGSASDSTAYNSPNQNSYSPLSEDKNDDSKNPILPPITDIESTLPVNDQPTPGETPTAPTNCT